MVEVKINRFRTSRKQNNMITMFREIYLLFQVIDTTIQILSDLHTFLHQGTSVSIFHKRNFKKSETPSLIIECFGFKAHNNWYNFSPNEDVFTDSLYAFDSCRSLNLYEMKIFSRYGYHLRSRCILRGRSFGSDVRNILIVVVNLSVC